MYMIISGFRSRGSMFKLESKNKFGTDYLHTCTHYIQGLFHAGGGPRSAFAFHWINLPPHP